MILSSQQFRKLRIDAGLTQRELAQLVGVSQAHIAKIENAKVDPRLSTVNKILQVLVEGEGRICRDIMTRSVISAKPSDRILRISEVMMRNAISQLPVMHENKIVGTVTEQTIIKNLQMMFKRLRIQVLLFQSIYQNIF